MDGSWLLHLLFFYPVFLWIIPVLRYKSQLFLTGEVFSLSPLGLCFSFCDVVLALALPNLELCFLLNFGLLGNERLELSGLLF